MKIIISFLLTTIFVYAHPHVFVDVKFDIKIEDDEANIDVYWYFDEMTSQLILMDFDRNRNGKLDESEIKYIEKEAFSHLVDFEYYTFAYQNGSQLTLSKPTNFTVYIEKFKVVYKFNLTTKIDLSKKNLKIGSFDDDMGMAFGLDKNTKVATNNQNIKLSSISSIREDMDFYIAHMLLIKWEGI
ncbi:DUF1007 family protein [Arcobacter sp. FWKO B]|uniref:DUF1007 family protein n=1 Tax=Arcobacter sp. FWKO B TaxID=2593672 RepID=UPI0018A4F74A|nr:DUF1007 family protein [Arcobacter sp. FWKO B]QOG12827.1 DUF1007 family protein [Arcobacter sp. FWKO B]